MIQAEVGGAARVDPGIGVQRPGFMIRDFTLISNPGEDIRISSFRGRSNLAVVFLGHSDAMRSFLNDIERHGREFFEQGTKVVVVVPYGLEEQTSPIGNSPLFLVLYDKTHAVYRRSGAMDKDGHPIPLVYVTDRFGEIVSVYVAPGHSMPPRVQDVLNSVEFANRQCPECEPPEWPRIA